MEDCGAARERLADRFGQREILRAGEYPAPRRRVLVDQALDVGWEIRASLDLVDNGSVGKLGEKSSRIGQGQRTDVQGLKVGVGVIWENRPAERTLSTLPRTGDRNGRKYRRSRLDTLCQVAFDHNV